MIGAFDNAENKLANFFVTMLYAYRMLFTQSCCCMLDVACCIPRANASVRTRACECVCQRVRVCQCVRASACVAQCPDLQYRGPDL